MKSPEQEVEMRYQRALSLLATEKIAAGDFELNSPEHQLWYQDKLDRLDRSMQRQWRVRMLVITALAACAIWLAGRLLWAILSGGV